MNALSDLLELVRCEPRSGGDDMGVDRENPGKIAAIDEDGSGDTHHQDVEGQDQSNPKMDLEERPT
jgi:hypothetical protein